MGALHRVPRDTPQVHLAQALHHSRQRPPDLPPVAVGGEQPDPRMRRVGLPTGLPP